MKLFVIIISQILFNFVHCQPHKLYEYINNRYRFFSTATVYKYVTPLAPYPMEKTECSVLQIWMMIRHGTRYPSKNIITELLELNKYKPKNNDRSELKKEEIEALNSWKFELTEDDKDKLINQGTEDMKSLGRNVRILHEDIFKKELNKFKIMISPIERCKKSARRFLEEAFQTTVNIEELPKMKENDKRFNLVNRTKKIDETNYEKEFIKGPEMKGVINNVYKKIGLTEPLDFKAVKAMHDACRYQKSENINYDSHWCAVFTDEDLKIFEYYYDLKYYYSHGYGQKKNVEESRSIIQDLIDNFNNNNEEEVGGVLYFGHTINVLSVIVGLGFAKDTEHLTNAYVDGMKDRKWRTSYLDPFSSNVRAVLYKCGNDTKVKFFINDAPMYVEKHKCTLCSWKLIEELLASK